MDKIRQLILFITNLEAEPVEGVSVHFMSNRKTVKIILL